MFDVTYPMRRGPNSRPIRYGARTHRNVEGSDEESSGSNNRMTWRALRPGCVVVLESNVFVPKTAKHPQRVASYSSPHRFVMFTLCVRLRQAPTTILRWCRTGTE